MRLFLVAGGISGALAVAAGAFGAHVLTGTLEDRLLEAFNTAARYQLIHSVALVLVALLAVSPAQRCVRLAGFSFLAGVVLFSGSLYLLALTGVRWLGAITPLGGLLLIGGWLGMAWSAVHRTTD